MAECAHILVVEDEGIIAMHIENTLKNLGYGVSLASSSQEALQIAAQRQPDLALLDIILGGGKDGIETAAELSRRFAFPFVYLTGHADQKTVERAKATEPFGYILKPFQEGQLATTIEIALRRHAKETTLKKGLDWSAALLEIVPDAVIMVDTQKRVSYMNAAGELLTGCARETACHREAAELLQQLAQPQRAELEDALIRVLRDGEELTLAEDRPPAVGGDGASYRADRIVPLRDAHDSPAGATLVFRRVGRPEHSAGDLERVRRARAPGSQLTLPSGNDGTVADLLKTGAQTAVLEDPQTGLPSRVQAERVLAAAIREGKHIFVAPFVLERFRFLVQRFGLRLTEQAIQVYGASLAHGLAPGYELYRWSVPAFVVLVEREASLTHVRRELAHLGSMRMERVFEMRARSALLFISSGWTAFELSDEDSLDTVVRRIDDFVTAQQQQWHA